MSIWIFQPVEQDFTPLEEVFFTYWTKEGKAKRQIQHDVCHGDCNLVLEGRTVFHNLIVKIFMSFLKKILKAVSFCIHWAKGILAQ